MCLHVRVRVLIDGNDDDGPLNGAVVAYLYTRFTAFARNQIGRW